MKAITTRIGDKYFEDLKQIEKEEHTDRAEVVRKLLASGIKEWKIMRALNLLRQHKITIRTAAKLAGVSYLEVINLTSKFGIDIGYTLNNLREDMN